MPRSSRVPCSRCASSTTAPAPSPKRTQVLRSLQSRMREKVSAHITSERWNAPVLNRPSTVARPNTNPEHTACKSNAAPCVRPSPACTDTADAGNVLSGVEVASTIRSIDCASTPAAVSAARAAASAMSAVVSPFAAMRRSRMPVRCVIHSSEVSTIRDNSVLLRTRVGK